MSAMMAEKGGWAKKNPPEEKSMAVFEVVARPGIEPGTQGFSILCSTN